jgi:hypothetical protein
MTDNNTVTKLNSVQERLQALTDSLKDAQAALGAIHGNLGQLHAATAELLPLIESSSHDVAWQDAQSAVVPNQPTTAAELLAVFKNAMRNGVQAAPAASQTATHTPVKDISTGSSILRQAAPQPVRMNAAAFAGGTLTDQARELLKGRSYFEAIDALHKLHPSANRDNIRRAVARAQGR